MPKRTAEHDILGQYVAQAAVLHEKLSTVMSNQREVAENLHRAARALRSQDFGYRELQAVGQDALATDPAGYR